MIKRPILAAAMILIMAIVFLSRFFPSLLLQEPGFRDGEEILLSGTVSKIERKNQQVYVYLSVGSAGKALLLYEEASFDALSMKIGMKISSRCIFRAFQTARNEGNFDERSYFRSCGIFLKAQAADTDILDNRYRVLPQFLNDLRERMKDAIYREVRDPETASVLIAVCTGDRTELSADTRELYSRSGIAHLLAISGLHISLVGMGFFRLLRKRFRFLPSAVYAGILMLLFCILTGGSVSSVRAAVMFLLQLLSIGLGKTPDLLSSLSFAAILLLLHEPMSLFHSGFLLSFAAIASIAVLYPASGGREKERNKAAAGFLLSLSVTLGTLPLTANLYYEVPVYAVLLNLIVVPLMGMVLGTGLLSALIGMLHLLIGRFFIGLGVWLVRFIRLFCDFFGKLPANSVICGHLSSPRILLYYGLLLAGTGFLKWIRARTGKRAIWQSLILIGSLLCLLFLRFEQRQLVLSFLDVGQGDCILLESPQGHVYLIDGGSSSIRDVAEYRVEDAMKYKGISRIDYCFVTHPDTDHISGILELLEQEEIRIGQILLPSVPDSENGRMLVSAAEKHGVPVREIHAGMAFQDGELRLTCLHPSEGYRSESINGYSVVLDLRYGSFSALLTGDLEADGEALLLAAFPGRLPEGGYDLLKVAHHGSRFSSTAAFLKAVSPAVAVISAGVDNVYGHPHEETLLRLTETGAAIYCTAECGEIIAAADGKGQVRIRTKV